MPRTARPSRSKASEFFQNLPLHEQISRATPVARQLLVEGIDYGQRIDLVTSDRVLLILRHDPELAQFIKGGSEDANARLEDWLEAARALGIAIGLMLRSDAFLTKGGVR